MPENAEPAITGAEPEPRATVLALPAPPDEEAESAELRRALSWLEEPALADAALIYLLVERWLLEYRSWRTRIEYARDLGRAADWLTRNADGLLRATRGQLAAWGEAMRRGEDRPVTPEDDERTRRQKTRRASETTIARRYTTVSSFSPTSSPPAMTSRPSCASASGTGRACGHCCPSTTPRPTYAGPGHPPANPRPAPCGSTPNRPGH